MSIEFEIPAGASADLQVEVIDAETVGAFLEGMPFVFATPRMVWHMECACELAARPHLPDGWVSVGTAVDIRHLAATPVGRTVTASAKVASFDGRIITFEVEAHDGVRKIGDGIHKRAAVDKARFESKLESA